MRDPKYGGDSTALSQREINLRIQEMFDGCPDCIERGDLCSAHYREACRLNAENGPPPVAEDELPELTQEEREACGL